jgi:hypothetical protein
MTTSTKAKSNRGYMGLVLIVILGLIGVKGLFWVCRDTALILDSRNWVLGDAVIDRSWLDKTWNRGAQNFSLRMRYHFLVSGAAYTGDRFEIPSRRASGDEEYFKRELAPYAPGSAVKIYYDPKDPTRSVVTKPQMDYFFTLFLGGLSLVFFAISIYVVHSFLRSKFGANRHEEPAA